MGYDVIQSTPASLDLDGILLYITTQLKNPAAAGALLKEYESRLDNLRESPRFYGPALIEDLARAGYHRFFFGNYVAFYKINDEERKVVIVRIFYQKQDYANQL